MHLLKVYLAAILGHTAFAAPTPDVSISIDIKDDHLSREICYPNFQEVETCSDGSAPRIIGGMQSCCFVPPKYAEAMGAQKLKVNVEPDWSKCTSEQWYRSCPTGWTSYPHGEIQNCCPASALQDDTRRLHTTHVDTSDDEIPHGPCLRSIYNKGDKCPLGTIPVPIPQAPTLQECCFPPMTNEVKSSVRVPMSEQSAIIHTFDDEIPHGPCLRAIYPTGSTCPLDMIPVPLAQAPTLQQCCLPPKKDEAESSVRVPMVEQSAIVDIFDDEIPHGRCSLALFKKGDICPGSMIPVPMKGADGLQMCCAPASIVTKSSVQVSIVEDPPAHGICSRALFRKGDKCPGTMIPVPIEGNDMIQMCCMPASAAKLTPHVLGNDPSKLKPGECLDKFIDENDTCPAGLGKVADEENWWFTVYYCCKPEGAGKKAATQPLSDSVTVRVDGL